MGAFLVYIIKSALCLGVFYLFYRLLLSRETLHHFNRVALLGVLLLSAVVPLIEVSTEQPIGVGQTMLTLEQWLAPAGGEPEASPAPMEEARTVWPLVLLGLYCVGVLFFLVRNVCSLVRLWQLLRVTQRDDIHRYVPDAPRVWLLVHRRKLAPFSWMRCIVISRRDLEEDGRPILLHELAHTRRGHSWDLLLVDLCCFIQWFNPAAWLLKQELQTVHEYEADEAVLSAGINAKEYQLLLIKKAVGTRLYSMANSLNHSKLKKRITMMMKEKSSKWACAKFLYVLPLAAVAVAAFARPEVSEVSNGLSSAKVTDLAAIVKAGSEKSVSRDTVVSIVVSSSDDSGQDKTSLGTSRVGQDLDSLVVYDAVEQSPAFPGGMSAMLQYCKDNMRYPQTAKEKGIEGHVVVQFIVDETGKVTKPEVLRGIDAELDAEAIRLVKAMPRWTPGRRNGKAVPMTFTIPVKFRLDDKGEAASSTSVSVSHSTSNGNSSSFSYSTSRSGTSSSSWSINAVVLGKDNGLYEHIGIVAFSSPKGMTTDPDSVFIVIDGVPATQEMIQTIVPQQISSISMLKGEAARKLYGDRAKHGAILVGTKNKETENGQVSGK